MITTFELKNSAGFSTFYRLPYFIKNMILLLILFMIMIPTYLLHNKTGELSIKTVERMIAGLNSHIFDYLLSNAEHELKITDQVKS